MNINDPVFLEITRAVKNLEAAILEVAKAVRESQVEYCECGHIPAAHNPKNPRECQAFYGKGPYTCPCEGYIEGRG